MSKEDKAVHMIAGAAMVIFLPVFFVTLAVIDGWVLSVLWRWFVVTTFGIAALSVPQAIGIQLVIGKLRGVQIGTPKGSRTGLAAAIAAPFVALGLGSLVRLWL